MGRKILLADDSKLVREMVKTILEKNGFDVDVVSGGCECLDKISNKKYDLAIVDYIMPDLDGLEVLAEVMNIRKDLPVILLTGKGSEEIAVEAMKLGALDYVVKTENYAEVILHVVKEDLDICRPVKAIYRGQEKRESGEGDRAAEGYPEVRDRILVVDDSKVVRKMMVSVLEKNGFDVDTASGGRECLEKAASKEYDLMLVDFFMPDMDGLEILKEIKDKPYNVPVIILTGRGSEKVAVKTMKMGALDYLVKAIGYLQVLPDVIRDNLYVYRAGLIKGKKKKRKIPRTRERILVVDDSLTVRNKIKSILSPENYHIDVASSGCECLKKINKNEYDLILIDYIMPDMDGLEVLKEITNRGLDIPVIFLTGKGSEEIAVKALKMGAMDYAVKTIGYLELIPEVIRRNLDIHRMNRDKKLLEMKLLEKNQDLEKRIKQLRAFNDISKQIGESLDINKTLSVIISRIAKLLECSKVTVMMLDEERNYLTIKAVRGFDEKEASKIKIKTGECISGYVAMTGDAVFSLDIENDPHFEGREKEPFFTKSLISVPLIIRDNIIGVLTVNDKHGDNVFTIDNMDVLITISYNAAIAIENSRKYEETKQASLTDSLTGLYNQGQFFRSLDVEVERARRYRSKLSMMIIDIDGFKKVNDTYGHQEGDRVLAEFAGILSGSIRKPDILARYGGEEFVIILTQTGVDGAGSLAERLRSKIESHVFSSDVSGELKIIISLGLAEYREGMMPKELVGYADKALYRAKQTGKNTFCIHETES